MKGGYTVTIKRLRFLFRLSTKFVAIAASDRTIVSDYRKVPTKAIMNARDALRAYFYIVLKCRRVLDV